jgi:hypothetical protein
MRLVLKRFALLIALTSIASAQSTYLISKPGKVLLTENFDQAPSLPTDFQSGAGEWVIVDKTLRGQQQEKDHHTAFRKIQLDHQDVIYEFDYKIEGDAFSQLLINYDLVHLAKAVTRVDGFSLYKLSEQTKRDQMIAGKRDQGVDPLKGDWSEKNTLLDKADVTLVAGQWHHVIVEMIGDQLAMQVNGQPIQGHHRGLTEKKTNFGFQAGGLEGYVFYDNITVRQALPLTRSMQLNNE